MMRQDRTRQACVCVKGGDKKIWQQEGRDARTDCCDVINNLSSGTSMNHHNTDNMQPYIHKQRQSSAAQ
jgi:hypothetical protein